MPVESLQKGSSRPQEATHMSGPLRGSDSEHPSLGKVRKREVVKPTLSELMEDAGTGLDYEVRPDRMPVR
jgi:hypothetical protein